MVTSRSSNPGKDFRQQLYWRALSTSPIIEIIRGHFLTHTVSMPSSTPDAQGFHPMIQVIKTEEKGSDVNLASHMLMDGFKDRYDVAVMVTNDSDLVTPVKMIRRELGKKVGVIVPGPRPSRALKNEATFTRQIRPGDLRKCQFPDVIQSLHGTITKPNRW